MTVSIKLTPADFAGHSLPGIGQSENRVGAIQAGAFASLLTDALANAGNTSSAATGSVPLDKTQIQRLAMQLQGLMNSRLFALIADEQQNGDFLIPYPRGMTVPAKGADREATSKNQRIFPKNDGAPIGDDLEGIIDRAAKTYGVDGNLIRSIIKAESNFEVRSTSPKGAMGLMQLMPATARELDVNNPYDAVENIMGGTRYLKRLLDRYRGDAALALAAYNWGMGNVERNPEKMPRETRDYISRVVRHYRGNAKV